MQLPYGTLFASYQGPGDLGEIGENVAREGLTGYLRVSAFEKGGVRECVVVYMTGKPVMAFTSEGATDNKDPDRRQIEVAIRKDNAIVEVCRLQDKQVKLLQDLYREFAVTPAAPPVKMAPKEPPKAVPRPEEKPRAGKMPEIRGRFLRAEEVGSLDEYIRHHPGETGHLLFMARRDGRTEEEHIILLRGKIEAVYNATTSGVTLLNELANVPGQGEFYAVDEALLTSVMGRYARATSAGPAEPAPAVRPMPGIGILAKDLLEGPHSSALSPREDTGRPVDEISGGIDDDIAMVRKVEHDFASHVDELLSKLELSHLRTRKKR